MTAKDLARDIYSLIGKRISSNYYPRLGRIIKQYSEEEIKDVFTEIRHSLPKGFIDNPVGYLHGCLSRKHNKKEAKQLLEELNIFD